GPEDLALAGLRGCGVLVPGYAAGGGHRLIEPAFGLVDQRRGLMEAVACGQGVHVADLGAAGVIEGLRTAFGVRGGELIEDLPQRADTGEHISEHPVEITRVFEGTAGVREAAEG